jgi:hypothetical protein
MRLCNVDTDVQHEMYLSLLSFAGVRHARLTYAAYHTTARRNTNSGSCTHALLVPERNMRHHMQGWWYEREDVFLSFRSQTQARTSMGSCVCASASTSGMFTQPSSDKTDVDGQFLMICLIHGTFHVPHSS